MGLLGVFMPSVLDDNKLKLLALLSLHTKPAGDDEYDHYIKNYVLLCIIYDLIIRGVLDYDYSSRLILWRGAYVFMNVSQEALVDLDFLVEKGLLKKIKFSTQGHLYVVGYRVTETGREVIRGYPEKLEEVRKALACECGEIMSIAIEEDGAYYVCCGEKKKIGCLSTEDVGYEAEPIIV